MKRIESLQPKIRGAISIKYKLFITILAGACALVLCMFLLMQWSFNRGFLKYVNRLEVERFEHLAEQVQADYRAHGDWDFLRGNIRTWLKLLVSSMPQPEAGEKYLRRIETETRRGGVYAGEPLLPGTAQTFENRVFLLDENHDMLFGTPPSPPLAELRAITCEGRSVGYLGMVPGEAHYNAHQVRFLNEQMLEFHLAAGIMIVIAASFSLPLAYRIVKPVHILAASARALAMGHFETRAEVTSRDELGQFALDFNFMAMTLENNQKARRQFFADISHELRTPLAVLRGEIEAIQDGIRQPGPEAIGALHSEVMHLSRMVDDLYEISLSDVGALTYRKEKFDLGPVLDKKLALYRPEFAKKNIELVATNLPATGLPVFADAKRIQQLFANLFDNALKYTNAGGSILVELEQHGEVFTLHVQDSAPGVSLSELPRLFKRFYRADDARSRSAGGVGLGLAICKRIVEAHEGTIKAQPSPLGGLWMQVTLPMDGC